MVATFSRYFWYYFPDDVQQCRFGWIIIPNIFHKLKVSQENILFYAILLKVYFYKVQPRLLPASELLKQRFITVMFPMDWKVYDNMDAIYEYEMKR